MIQVSTGTRWNRRLGAGLALALACSAITALAAPPAIDVVDDRGRHVRLAAPAQRVVSLLPSLTETVCALGACQRLVGVDRYSNWPASVKGLPQLGGLEDTQIERLVALKPDLVLAVGAARAIDRLEALGITVMALDPQSMADTQRVLDKVSQALGDRAAGLAAWQRIDARITTAAARVPAALRGKKVYFEVAAAPYAAGAASFVGETLARLGLGNVVPVALGTFPQLNPEFVVRAQPDIVLASARALAEMPSRPGWAALTALQTRMACGFPADRWDPLVRPGPRLADAAEILADCLAALPSP